MLLSHAKAWLLYFYLYNSMQIIKTNDLSPEQREEIRQLWNREYPEKLAYDSIAALDHYLNNLADTTHYLLINDLGTINGWAFTFLRDGERWFAIIIHGKIQRQGYGAALLSKLKGNEYVLNGWVMDHDRDFKKDGTPYLSPLRFYEKNGFTMQPDIRLDLEILSAVKIVWRKM